MKKILIVSSCPTHPVTAGNRKGILNQVDALKTLGCDVFFLYINVRPIRQQTNEDITLTELRRFWGDHLYVWTMPSLVHLYQMVLQKIRIKFNKGYLKVDDLYPHALTGVVRKIQNANHFDCCIVNYYYLSKLFTKVSFPIRALFTHDYFAYKSILVGNENVGYNTTAHEEAVALQRSPNIFSVNTDESIYFRKLSPKSRIFNIFSHYTYIPSDFVGNNKLLFFSGNNDYNINGLNWFLSNVFPVIKKEIPNVEMIIGGSICKSVSIRDEQIKLMGLFDNPADFYSLGDIVVNPTYEGTGLKIKTFEAISYDKVVIAHPHSVEGIFKPDEAPVLLAKAPREWAACINKAMNNREIINDYKRRDKKYMEEMNEFIESEYINFLNSES